MFRMTIKIMYIIINFNNLNIYWFLKPDRITIILRKYIENKDKNANIFIKNLYQH